MASDERQAVLDRIQGILDTSIAKGVPGISAAIRTSAGQTYTLRAGHKGLQTATPLDDDTAFGTGSITKIFIAVVTLQLITEHKLRLDDTVNTLLGPGPWDDIPNAHDARIGQLLSHTSAIASWEDEAAWIRDGRGANVQPGKIWRKDETLPYVRPESSAGLTVGGYHYANTNYTLLGLVIERVTGVTAESEVRRRILTPLGLRRTYLEGFEEVEVETARRYHWATETFVRTAGLSPYHVRVRDDLVDVSATNLSVSWTAGGMISTPSDLLIFADALQSGRLLDSGSMDTLMEWHDAGERMDMGHGLFRLRNARADKTWVGHNGGVLGFTAALWWSIDGGCAFSVLANVGSSHAGEVPSNAAIVALKTELLELATRL